MVFIDKFHGNYSSHVHRMTPNSIEHHKFKPTRIWVNSVVPKFNPFYPMFRVIVHVKTGIPANP